MWYNFGAARGAGVAAKNRDRVAAKMTPAQIDEAQRLAREGLTRPSRQAVAVSPPVKRSCGRFAAADRVLRRSPSRCRSAGHPAPVAPPVVAVLGLAEAGHRRFWC
jgi:hypothetical protein